MLFLKAESEKRLSDLMKIDYETFETFSLLLSAEIYDITTALQTADAEEDFRVLNNFINFNENILFVMVNEITSLLEETNFYYNRTEYLMRYTKFEEVTWKLAYELQRLGSWSFELERRVFKNRGDVYQTIKLRRKIS